MHGLIDIIQTATTDGATVEQKQAAAVACRTLLSAFEAEAGKPMAPSSAPAPTSSPLAVLGKLDPDQALDLLIAKLRATVPSNPQPQPARAAFKVPLLRVPTVPIPSHQRRKP